MSKRFKELNTALSTTVEELGEEYLSEGINDPYLFKAIFMAGGAGSGKSYVADHSVKGMGLKLVNSDPEFEHLLKKNKLSLKMADADSPLGKKQQALRAKGKALTAKRQEAWVQGMLGLVVDGTGKSYDKISRQAQALKSVGYDVGMIFVDTSLETSLARNAKRKRTVDPKIVEELWKGVHANKDKFKQFFGNSFKLVDSNKTKEGAEAVAFGTALRKYGMNWLKNPLKNPVGKKKLDVLRKISGKTLRDLPGDK